MGSWEVSDNKLLLAILANNRLQISVFRWKGLIKLFVDHFLIASQ